MSLVWLVGIGIALMLLLGGLAVSGRLRRLGVAPGPRWAGPVEKRAVFLALGLLAVLIAVANTAYSSPALLIGLGLIFSAVVGRMARRRVDDKP